MSEEIPESIKARVNMIHQRTEIPVAEIMTDYREIMSDPFIMKDPQFKTDEERERYAGAILWQRFISRPPVREYSVIPIGIGGLRVAGSGNLNSELYALVKSTAGTKLRRIVLQGEQAHMINSITRFSQYVVKLGEFSRGGDMVADNRSRFQDPVATRLTARATMDALKLREVKVSDAINNPTRVGSDGYQIRTDWVRVRGFITRANRFTKKKDGQEGGVYNIMNPSDIGMEPRVTDDGTVVNNELTCWVAPQLMTWAVESECDFAGTISVYDSKVEDAETGEVKKVKDVSMNCYFIAPVHGKRGGIQEV